MISTKIRRLFTTLIVAATLVLTGCGAGGELTYDSAEDAYLQGMELYEEGDYERAIEYFRAVFRYGRTVERADDAQFYLAKSYMQQGRHRVAATEFQRFTELYRTDDRVPEAEYQRAMAYYELSPHYKLDQTDTERSIGYFQLFTDRYPNHERASEAEERIRELRGKLARKMYDSADLYERRGQYQAAARTYERVFDRYPDTEWADNAILGVIRTYFNYAEESVEARQPERYQSAIEWYNRMAQVFPDSEHIRDAERYYERAAARLEALGESPSSIAGS